MYKVTRIIHEKHGKVIAIEWDDAGPYHDPFAAVKQAKSLRNDWVKEGALKVRMLVDNQVMIVKGAESWAFKTYKELPKCGNCPKILDGEVFTHQYCRSNLFCSQDCADKDFDYIVSQWDEEYECDL